MSRAADMQAGYEKGRAIMRSQVYDVKRIVERGDEIAAELNGPESWLSPCLAYLPEPECERSLLRF